MTKRLKVKCSENLPSIREIYFPKNATSIKDAVIVTNVWVREKSFGVAQIVISTAPYSSMEYYFSKNRISERDDKNPRLLTIDRFYELYELNAGSTSRI